MPLFYEGSTDDKTAANYRSLVGKREGVATPDAATIAKEVEESSGYLKAFRARKSANATSLSNNLDLGMCAGYVHDMKRLAMMILRSTTHLWLHVVLPEVKLMMGRSLIRYRRGQGVVEDAHICIDYTQDSGDRGEGLMSMSPPDVNSAQAASTRKGKMLYRKLGSSDLEVSVASFGGANWAEELCGFAHQGLDERQSMLFEMLDVAWGRGVTLFDMAEQYPSITGGGYSEFVFGEWMKDRKIPRDKIVITTKVAGDGGNTSLACRYDVLGRPFSAEEPVPKKAKLTAVQITDACDASLKRLGVEYIDLLETHWPSRYVPKFGETGARYNRSLEHPFVSFDEQLDAMAALIKSGKVRAWGVSNETTYGVATFAAYAKLRGLPPPVSIQNDYSLCDRRFETELAEACSPLHCDVGLLCYGALCGGTLAGKYSFGRVPAAEARHKNMPGFQSRYTSAATLKAAEDYEELAKKNGMTVLELSLAYCYSRPFMASVILGARNPKQLAQQLDALDHVDKITPELSRQIDRIHHVCPNPNYSDTHSQFYPV